MIQVVGSNTARCALVVVSTIMLLLHPTVGEELASGGGEHLYTIELAGDWLIKQQLPEGGWRGVGQGVRGKGSVGTTSIAVLNLVRIYHLTDNPKYLDSAEKAGRWIIESRSKRYQFSWGDKPGGAPQENSTALALLALAALYNTQPPEFRREYENTLDNGMSWLKERLVGKAAQEWKTYIPQTNWIIQSLLAYYEIKGDKDALELAVDGGRWLLENKLETETGFGWPSSLWVENPTLDLLNTYHAINALITLKRLDPSLERRREYVENILRAARWMATYQGPGAEHATPSQRVFTNIDDAIILQVLSHASRLQEDPLLSEKTQILRAKIVGKQREDGGWGSGDSDTSNLITTLFVVSSLTDIPDVDVSKKVDKAEVLTGQKIVVTITIKNTGSVMLTDIDVVDQIPGGAVYKGSQPKEGNIIRWEVEKLPPDQISEKKYQLTITKSGNLTLPQARVTTAEGLSKESNSVELVVKSRLNIYITLALFLLLILIIPYLIAAITTSKTRRKTGKEEKEEKQ